jgi:hypothetical protein
MNVEIDHEIPFLGIFVSNFNVSLQCREENMMPYNGRLEREQRKKGL